MKNPNLPAARCSKAAGLFGLAVLAGVFALKPQDPSLAEGPAAPALAEGPDAELNRFLAGRLAERLASAAAKAAEYETHRDEAAVLRVLAEDLGMREQDLQAVLGGTRALSINHLIRFCLHSWVTLDQMLNPEYPLGGALYWREATSSAPMGETLGLLIAQRRIALQRTRQALAAQAAGVSAQDLRAIEFEERPVRLEEWREISRALGLDSLAPGKAHRPGYREIRASLPPRPMSEIRRITSAGEWLRRAGYAARADGHSPFQARWARAGGSGTPASLRSGP